MHPQAGHGAPESNDGVPAAGLPYGAVMASAGASMLAGLCGIRALVWPLLAWAVLQALWVPARHVWQAGVRSGWCGYWKRCPARRHAGMHTVPLGLAVITSGLAGLAAGTAGRWSLSVAYAALILAWLFTVLCLVRFLRALATDGIELRRMDGTWFLVPAALLGAGIATDLIAPLAEARGAAVLQFLARAGVAAGWLGYWIVAAIAAIRIARHGLGGVPQAPWWIAMGCAGLAAAAIGRISPGMPHGGVPYAWTVRATVVTAWVAIVLYVPVLVGSAAFLLRRCRFRARGAWAPTFSTAVFALGCFAAGDVSGHAAYTLLGHVAGYATLVFWLITTIWNAQRAWRGKGRHLADAAGPPST